MLSSRRKGRTSRLRIITQLGLPLQQIKAEVNGESTPGVVLQDLGLVKSYDFGVLQGMRAQKKAKQGKTPFRGLTLFHSVAYPLSQGEDIFTVSKAFIQELRDLKFPTPLSVIGFIPATLEGLPGKPAWFYFHSTVEKVEQLRHAIEEFVAGLLQAGQSAENFALKYTQLFNFRTP